MATIRSLAKKVTSLVLDTNLMIIGKSTLQWIIMPIFVYIVFSSVYDAYQKNKRLVYCSERGVSESQCDYFIEYGD